MSTRTIEGIWYPGELTPHMFYIHGRLSGMAAAIPRVMGEAQKWEAFDMRESSESKVNPIFLGSYDEIGLARDRIEKVLGASGIRPC